MAGALTTDRAKSPPNVLAQLMPKGSEHAYKVVRIKGTESADMDLEVSLLPIGGKGDMGVDLSGVQPTTATTLSDQSQSLGAKYPNLPSGKRYPAHAQNV